MVLIDLVAGALVVFLATGSGALGVFALKKVGLSSYSSMLSFAAGMMAFTSIEMLAQSHNTGGDMAVLIGLLCGIGVVMASEKALPHLHKRMKKKELGDSKKKALLMTGTIALHNIPEGFSVAAAFAASGPLGWLITTSIALQDIPEGAMVSVPLHAYGIGKRSAFFYGMLSGLFEALAALAGYIFLQFFSTIIPYALSFASGAMLFVVFVEILPDTMANGRERISALSFLGGALLAFAVSVLFKF